MTLTGVLETDLGFIRRSFRRGDNEPKIIKEHEQAITNHVKGRNVLCVEDYVCSGLSLKKVMQSAQKYEPEELRGASVNNSGYNNSLVEEVKKPKFHLYKLK
jgi:hypoxanthine-guanine phosphoribosyltransferase